MRPVSDAILGRVMLAFEGERVPARIVERLGTAPAAGVTLFRHLNVRTPGQVRELTGELQRAASSRGVAVPLDAGGAGGGPLLIAADQECGQFLALGDGSTAFAGNMALGAIDDVTLTERVGCAIGLEARAMGVNVVYAPVLDIASNPANPALGIRAFGDDPELVVRHGVAMVRGLQSAGVAATVKHAPGAGEAATDPHHGGATVSAVRDELERREFVPFRAAFAAGARMAMSGHFAVPAVSGRADLPATLARNVMTDLLRRDLGFDGVTISDALDMRALAQGPDQAVDVIAAVRAGVDLLLAAADPEALARIERTLVRAADRELFDPAELAATERRVAALRGWLREMLPHPDLGVVGGTAHHALADEVAARSITAVADPRRLLPLTPGRTGRILAIQPQPTDLTPADTSSTVRPALAAALRRYHADVEELIVDIEPDAASIAAARDRAAAADVVVIGTVDAHRLTSQLGLVEAIAATGTPTIAVAMRGPWDAAAYPRSVSSLATYSILPGSLGALAAVLFGETQAPGRLPVRVEVPVVA